MVRNEGTRMEERVTVAVMWFHGKIGGWKQIGEEEKCKVEKKKKKKRRGGCESRRVTTIVGVLRW